MSIIPSSHQDLLKSTALAHIATLGPDGGPQSSPVWFEWTGEYILFSNLKSRQKYRNVKKDPRIALSIVDPQNPYRYLEIRGTVERVDDDPDWHFINSMAKKYMGVDTYPGYNPRDERVVIVIKPEHTTKMG